MKHYLFSVIENQLCPIKDFHNCCMMAFKGCNGNLESRPEFCKLNEVVIEENDKEVLQ